MRRMIHILLYIVGTLAALLVIFIIIAMIKDYRPAVRETLTDLSATAGKNPRPLPDSLSILCWNIGYAGLGDDMDFFYDGGTQVRCSKSRTLQNLEDIISEIRRHDADIILLQEVDESSRRSWKINEVEALTKAFPQYHVYLAYNYKSFFVPIPVKAPLGKVASGVVMLSRYQPEEVCRWQYPSRFAWPVSMFNLKRCLMTASFSLVDGSRVVIGNTHNTAYDTGNMRTVETRFLGQMLDSLHSKGGRFIIGGDWNQYPVSYTPSERENSNPHFSTVQLDEDLLGSHGHVVYDPKVRTLRHLDTVYGPESVLTVTDYFFVSDSLDIRSIQAFDLHFRNSDHQPVLLKVRL